jgi:hypothetical protein
MLMTVQPIEKNARLELFLELPHRIEGKRRIEFEAVSTWTTETERRDFYDSGFRIQGLDAVDRECIARLMHDFGLTAVLH